MTAVVLPVHLEDVWEWVSPIKVDFPCADLAICFICSTPPVTRPAARRLGVPAGGVPRASAEQVPGVGGPGHIPIIPFIRTYPVRIEEGLASEYFVTRAETASGLRNGQLTWRAGRLAEVSMTEPRIHLSQVLLGEWLDSRPRRNLDRCSSYFVRQLCVEQLMSGCLSRGKQVYVAAIVKFVGVVTHAGFILS